MMKIPRCMSTQHPDNVTVPVFAKNPELAGEDEVFEAYYAFSKLGIDEQLWDAEGKEVDNFVVKKLLAQYPDYFTKNILGKDKFLTIRVPNPDIEKDEGKILVETLHSIPRNFDIAHTFYQDTIPPIFEVFVPMCTSETSLIRIHEYYRRFIIKSQHEKLRDDDITIREWVGALQPDDIRVTPLFETKEAISNADTYVEKYSQYLRSSEAMRVWFARSDPALYYGSVSAVLLVKVGLLKLHVLQQKLSIDIFPIIGCGSAPFRGNFKPTNAAALIKGYPSIQTFTVQSAFKYDYPETQVVEAVETVQSAKRKEPLPVDVPFALQMVDKMEQDYMASVRLITDKIAMLSRFVPPRRKRKLHIGLFGYARKKGELELPRAITFCAALYSLGLPPEIFGMSGMTEHELDNIRTFYKTLDMDMADALQFLNKDNLKHFPHEVQKKVLKASELFDYETDQAHAEITSRVMEALRKNDTTQLQDYIIAAGKLRQFLG